jgi:hypothetical protein
MGRVTDRVPDPFLREYLTDSIQALVQDPESPQVLEWPEFAGVRDFLKSARAIAAKIAAKIHRQ